MNSWLAADWKGFLNNRILLYELCELCATFPAAGTPSQAVGLGRYFSDWVCLEIDKGLALWRAWYTARAHDRVKSGKHGTRPKYDTLDAVLGIDIAREQGWIDGDEPLDQTAQDYRMAMLEAMRSGKELDIVEFLESRAWGDGDENEAQDED